MLLDKLDTAVQQHWHVGPAQSGLHLHRLIQRAAKHATTVRLRAGGGGGGGGVAVSLYTLCSLHRLAQ